MAITDYAKALKSGEKDYRANVSKGLYPYLPVLDELISHVEIDYQVSLGLVEIPIKSIVGTYSSGRTTAFASNFMPILEQDSEFAQKWGTLYDSLEEEGLRDPIKAYEFNNKFYVMEGNKRVSVLKFMDAVSIEGTVVRMVPKKIDDTENRIYFEFLDFYDKTGINYLYMSEEGNFKRLLEVTYGEDIEKWDKDQELEFRAFFTFFEKEFLARAQNKVSITSGDAACVYLEIFGYKEAQTKSQTEIRKDIARVWNELLVAAKPDQVRLILNPTPESQKTSLMNLFPVGTPKIKIAFIHDRSVQTSAWTYSHELGRKYIQDVFGDKIDTCAFEQVDVSEADEVFEKAISDGNRVIFATSPKLASPALKAAINHPDVNILNCSMNINHKMIRSYYLRMYEAKFISGAIAGSILKEGTIGYLSDYPIHGTTAEINAFALGVQMTNPQAKVVLEWTQIKNRDAEEEFKKKHVTLISGRDMNATRASGKEFGLFMLNDDGSHTNLAMPVRHWGKLYEEIIRSVMRGAYKNDDTVAGQQGLNYFWGMSSEAVDVIYSRNLPAGAVRLLRNLRAGIKSMEISPFTGPMYSQDGMLRCVDGQVLSPQECVDIDWLLENIEGYIPEISELKEDALGLVKIQGVKTDAD